MEYPKKTVNGDAGEYLVAYTITKLFGWPCRLFGVDIGVDAELEIMDDSACSTGDIIKIQVKAFDSISSSDSKNIYVDDRHINYWKRFCLPVIICCVDLKTATIYWKQIRATEAYESGGVSRKISLDLVSDKLSAASKADLRSLATPEASKQIEPLFKQLQNLYKTLDEQGIPYGGDIKRLDSIEKVCTDLDTVIVQIENLILHFPWRVGSLDLRTLSHIKRNIQIMRNDVSYSYNVSINGM